MMFDFLLKTTTDLLFAIILLVVLQTSCNNSETSKTLIDLTMPADITLNSDLNRKVIQEQKEHNKITARDSLNLKKYRRQILSEVIELDYPTSELSDSALEALVDQELRHHWGIFHDTIYHAPDSLFKIYQFFGETVGAYSNPFWHSFLHFNSGKIEISKEVDIADLKNIYLLSDNKYLLVHERYGRGASVYSDVRLKADLISFKDSNLIYHPIKTPNYCWLSNDVSSGQIELVNGSYTGNNLLEMEFNPKTQELKYTFSNNVLYLCSVDSSYTYTGTYQYINGTFIHQNEEITGVKGSY